MTTTPALEIINATLELGDGDARVAALNNVSLTVNPGEFVAIVGTSGSGKSSLLAIGFVFQSGNLLPALTAADQLRLSARLAANTKADVLALLDAVGMSHRANNRPGQLSGGERQRGGIARALVNTPSLLLVDEPTAALDRARSHEVVRLLAERARLSNVAVVMVTHDRDVLEYPDRVLEMIDGTLTEVSAISVR